MREMLPIMDPDEDYLTIVAAEESIGASEARRKKELEEAHANLRGAYPSRLEWPFCCLDASLTCILSHSSVQDP